MNTPFSDANTPVSNVAMPSFVSHASVSNTTTPFSGANTPVSNARNPSFVSHISVSNMNTPFSGANTPVSNTHEPSFGEEQTLTECTSVLNINAPFSDANKPFSNVPVHSFVSHTSVSTRGSGLPGTPNPLPDEQTRPSLTHAIPPLFCRPRRTPGGCQQRSVERGSNRK